MASGAANRQLPPGIQRNGINELGGERTVKDFGSWNIPQNLNDTHTIPDRQDFRSSSTAPEMYSLGCQHATPSNITSFSSSGIGYGSLGTRTATPGPPDTGSIHSMQTSGSFGDMNTYSYDGDGDVVMQDLEDLKAIMDVMHHVHEKRFRDDQLYPKKASSSRPVISLARMDNPAFILVIDTSFILSHLHLVEAMVSLHDIYGSVVMIPWATIQELDGLRKSSGRITTTASVSLLGSRHNLANKITRMVEVSRLARQAVNWQLKMFQQMHKGVWGQKREECIDIHACGDDAILSCARYFKEIRGFVTVLLSDDRNLCVKARVYDLLTVSFDPGVTHTARAILDKTAAEVKAVQPHLSSRPAIPSPRSPSAPYLPAYRQNSPLTQSYIPSYTMADKDAQMEDAPMPIIPSPSRPTTHNSSPIIDTHNSSRNLSHSIYSSPAQLPPTSRFPPVHVPNPQSLVSAQPIKPSIDMDREIRGSVCHLLERAFTDIMTAVPTLMHYLALFCFGEAYNLEYLKIDLKRVQNLEQIEQELSKHWHTIFSEAVSYNTGVKAKEGRLSQPYHNWSKWAGNRPGTKPRKIELRSWIADWTSLWKGLYSKAIQASQLEILSDERLDWHKTEKWSRQLEMIAL
ncbi:PIN domain-containing protein [Terfezia claveryi]|nr:PIN domain-containing protein [Terfezia claveryi]